MCGRNQARAATTFPALALFIKRHLVNWKFFENSLHKRRALLKKQNLAIRNPTFPAPRPGSSCLLAGRSGLAAGRHGGVAQSSRTDSRRCGCPGSRMCRHDICPWPGGFAGRGSGGHHAGGSGGISPADYGFCLERDGGIPSARSRPADFLAPFLKLRRPTPAGFRQFFQRE